KRVPAHARCVGGEAANLDRSLRDRESPVGYGAAGNCACAGDEQNEVTDGRDQLSTLAQLGEACPSTRCAPARSHRRRQRRCWGRVLRSGASRTVPIARRSAALPPAHRARPGAPLTRDVNDEAASFSDVALDRDVSTVVHRDFSRDGEPEAVLLAVIAAE